MTERQLIKLFKKHEDSDEFLEFDRIPAERRKSNRPDVHAFIMLDNMVSGTNQILATAKHDEVYLGIGLDDLVSVITEEQVVDLIRCGVGLDSDEEGLHMFV